MRSKKREPILERIAADCINELSLKWQKSTPDVINSGFEVVEGQIDFFPSPVSTLWAEVPKQELDSPLEDRERRNFEAREAVRAKPYQLPYPSTIECFLTIESHGKELTELQLQESAIDWICSALPERIFKEPIFGYGCVHGTCRRMSMLYSMGGVVEWTDRLGSKFENIYPILIGPRESCEGLASALPGHSSVIMIAPSAASAIVSIPPETVAATRDVPAVRDWVVLRDFRDFKNTNVKPEALEEMFRRMSAIPTEAPFLAR